MYLLGYIPKDNRLYLGDKELNIVSFSLLVSVLEYQTAVMRRDFETADKVLPTVPKEQRTRVAHFLEKQVGMVFVVVAWFFVVSPQVVIVFISLGLFSFCCVSLITTAPWAWLSMGTEHITNQVFISISLWWCGVTQALISVKELKLYECHPRTVFCLKHWRKSTHNNLSGGYLAPCVFMLTVLPLCFRGSNLKPWRSPVMRNTSLSSVYSWVTTAQPTTLPRTCRYWLVLFCTPPKWR